MVRNNSGVIVIRPLRRLPLTSLLCLWIIFVGLAPGTAKVFSQADQKRPQTSTATTSSPPPAASPSGSPASGSATADTPTSAQTTEPFKPTSSVSEPVTFVQITDAHVFDGGKKRATEQQARQEQQDNWNALHWALLETNQLIASGAKIDFVVFTGDLGLEFVRRPNDPVCPKPNANPDEPGDAADASTSNVTAKPPPLDDFQKAQENGWIKLYSFEGAASKIADEFSLLRVPVVYFLPGNNDLVGEDPCDLPRYKDFVALIGQDIPGRSPRIVDLTAAQPPPEVHGFSLLGLNSASFKDSDNYLVTCTRKLQPGCPQYEMSQLQPPTPAVASAPLYLVFTHVPYLKDPYYGTPSWRKFPADSLSAWKVAVGANVAGIFAGHFHDPRRFLYATRSDGTGLSIPGDDDIARKTWVAPPLALKTQEKSSVTARGFLLVQAQKVVTPSGATGLISVIPFWFSDHAPGVCLYLLWAVVVILIAALVIFAVWGLTRRAMQAPHKPIAAAAPPWLFSLYPAILTLALFFAIAILVWEVMNFAIHRLHVELFYVLIPIFGAVGGAIGSILRGDNGDNKIVLTSVESSSRIRAGIVGDVAIGIGGAATVVFLFERALPIDPKQSTSFALLISISFIAGVFGRNIIELARQKFVEKLIDQKVREAQEKKTEIDRTAKVEASKLKEQAREAINHGKPAEALKLLDDALQRDPTFIYAYIEKGRALRRLGNLEAALATLKEALAKDPDNTKVLYNMACYKTLLGRPRNEILADLKKALGDPSLQMLAATDDDFKTLLDDPDFKKLLLPPKLTTT